jgi:hypothetical protein
VAVHPTTEASRPTTSVTTVFPSLGMVCGYSVLVGGPSGAQKVPPPGVARECTASPASGNRQLAITVTASDQKRYVVHSIGLGRWLLWSARLPSGMYHALGWGCFGPGQGFALRAGETLRSVAVYRGCDVP